MPFSNQTRYIVALQSSGRCANPDCRKRLIENNKMLGEFCHIEGEKEGSARYNFNQTEIQRNEHQNAIMLCASCHTLVDKDETNFTTPVLFSWKKSDQESAKLEDWLEKGVLLERVLAMVERDSPVRPPLLLGERSLFVGRIAEIAELTRLIDEGVKVLSLIGEGGIGKTSVSIKLIRQLENSYDLTIPINIKKNMTYQDFLLDIIKFTYLPLASNLQQDDLQNLIREIFSKVGRILVWVDNYENVADFIDTGRNNDLLSIHSFLETLPNNVTIILNSRNRSNLEGETVVNINGLCQEDAVKLFIQISSRHLARPISVEMESKINEICHLVDGHPLAIKLLGGAYKGGGASHLSGMYDELNSAIKNMRESTERFRSINACFDYSYQRLSPKLKLALSRLVLLKSYFTAEAAKYIFGVDKSVLFDLYERTFLQRYPIQTKVGDEIFVYDFHPVVRKYLQGKSSGAILTAYELQRYIEHYSDFIINLYRDFRNDISKHTRLLDLLTADGINDFYEAISGIRDERNRSVISNLLGLLLLQSGHKKRALFYHELCYEIDSRLGELDKVANDLNNIGACLSENAYSDKALAIHIKLAEEYENNERYRDSANQYFGSGRIYSRKGDYENAERSYRKALSNFRKANSGDRDIADTLLNLSTVLMQGEKYQEAIDSSLDIIPLYQRLGDQLSVADVRSNLSVIYTKRGGPRDLEEALKSIENARDIDLHERNTRGLIRDYRIMTKVYRKMNDEINASKCEVGIEAAILNFERETHEPFTDSGYYDFLQYS